MSNELISRMIDSIVDTINLQADELTFLDQAIGDGDHGTNLKRGAESLLKNRDEIAGLDFGPALKKAGTTIVMTVGGASGPLYGSALLAMAREAGGMPADSAGIGKLTQVGVNAVKARGRSDVGAKTMLDVLVPVHEAVMGGASLNEVRMVAEKSVEATRTMQATKGRASFLGIRSIGHVDPGARSAAYIVEAICNVLEQR